MIRDTTEIGVKIDTHTQQPAAGGRQGASTWRQLAVTRWRSALTAWPASTRLRLEALPLVTALSVLLGGTWRQLAHGSDEATDCTDCRPGTYNDVTAAANCIDCPVGKYTADDGSTQPTDCRILHDRNPLAVLPANRVHFWVRQDPLPLLVLLTRTDSSLLSAPYQQPVRSSWSATWRGRYLAARTSSGTARSWRK